MKFDALLIFMYTCGDIEAIYANLRDIESKIKTNCPQWESGTLLRRKSAKLTF